VRRLAGSMKARLATLALIALGYVALGVSRGLSIYDEGIPVLGASRILEGDRPYRDFWSVYAPGQFYALAGLFKVFGTSLLVSRLASVAAIAGTAVLVYALARRLRLPTGLAVFATALWTVAVGAIAGATLSVGMFTALTLAFGSALGFLRFLQEPHRGWLAVSGAAMGLACVVRHDIGGCLLLAEATMLVGAMDWRTPGGAHRGLVSLELYLGAVVVPVAGATAILVGLGVPPGDLVDDLVVYPLTGYRAGRALPLPALLPDLAPLQAGRISLGQYAASVRTGLRFYFPVVVLVLTASVLACRRRLPSAGGAQAVVFVWLLALALLPYAWVRSDIAHIVPAWGPALLLLAWLIHQMPASGPWRAAGLALAVAWSAVFVWGAVVTKVDALAALIPGRPGLGLDGPRGAHITVGPEMASMQAAIRYVQAVVPRDERIFVGNAHHDSLVLNDVMFYFLAGRRSATKYHELVPGVATTAAVQRAIVQDLERHRVRHLVLRADPGYVRNPAGATILDQFIRERFEEVEEFGRYGVWRRREG